MGMFDTITIDYPLPGENPYGYREFQTKDLDSQLYSYRIDADGQMYGPLEASAAPRCAFTGVINARCGNWSALSFGVTFTPTGEDHVFIDYEIILKDGKLLSIKQKSFERQAALPASSWR